MENGQISDAGLRDAVELSGDEERRLRAVVDIFSRLSIACKSRSLYPVEHPTAVDTVTLLHAVIEDSLRVTPGITVKVGKDSLIYERWVMGRRMESLRALASRIRSLNIQEIFIDAGASLQDAEALVELLVSDPEPLSREGGPEAFMLAKGVHSIGVVESEARRVDEEEPEEWRAGMDLEPAPEKAESPEVLTPEQAVDLLELLLNPEELGRVLMALSDVEGRPLGKEGLADAAFAFLRDAAAISKREHPEREEEWLRGMAESILFLDSDVRNFILLRNLVPGLREEPVCSGILNQFNAREMADLLSDFFPLIPELTPRAGQLLKAIGFREGEARHTLRLLRARLVDLGQVPPSMLASLDERTGSGSTGNRLTNALPSLEEIAEILGEYKPEEIEEIRLISEFDPAVDMLADTTPMLLDLLGQADSLDNPGKVVELLQQNFWGLVMSARLDIAAAVLKGARAVLQNAGPAIDPFRSDIAHMIEEAASENVIRRTIRLACSRRGDPRTVEGLISYIGELGEKGISAMIEALGSEDDMSARKRIVDTLAALCRDRIPLLGAYLEDPRWYLVRNIVTIMARVRSSETIPYLRRTFDHPNPKVKAETIRALGLTGGFGACEVLMQGLKDSDEKTRILCIRWLGRLEETRAAGYLIKMLEDKEPGAESLLVKKEIVMSLGGMRAPESYEALRKYQGKQKRLNRAEWQEINQAASEALRGLTDKFPHLERKR